MRDSSTLKVGDAAPNFVLSDSAGQLWQMEEHLPLALFFFRGTW
jgi:peroxiredoxin